MERQLGAMSKFLVLGIGLLVVALVADRMWTRHGSVDDSQKKKGEPVSLDGDRNPSADDKPSTFPIPKDRFREREAMDIGKALEEIFRVERVNSSGDPGQRERGLAKTAFREVERILRELEAQGLGGEDLYASAETRLTEANEEAALKMLDGVRRLQGELTGVGLDSMSPEEQFEYVVRARREAFGEEMADQLFFEEEAYTRYKLEEKALLEDTELPEEKQQAEIAARRNALQVALASRGSYVSFADERQSELNRKLKERYGEGVEAMSGPERTAAIRDMYGEELPPGMLDKAEQILAAQEERRANLEAYRQESEAILSNEALSFEEKQERLAELSAQTNAGPSPVGVQ